MAINFLNKVDYNQNELDHARIVNEGGNVAAGTGVSGQLYFDTTADGGVGVLKVWTDAWVEVGGGVESISFTNTGASTGAPLTGTISSGVYTVNSKAYAGGSNVGYVPSGGTIGQYLNGEGNWIDENVGDITKVDGGTYITATNAEGPEVSLAHDNTARTDTTSNGNVASGGQFTTIGGVTTNATGHVTAVDVKTFTIPNTAYDLETAATGTAIRLNPSKAGIPNDDVTISGTTGQTAMTRIDGQELRVSLTDDVTIIDDLTVGGDLDVTEEITASGTGQHSFGGQVTIPLTPIADTDAASKGFVDLKVAGIGAFKGSYNASTNSPALEGGSNVALDTGDYFVVSASGTFLSEALEPGDFIFANEAIAANSTPPISKYTVVQADANVAGAGTTDANTQKGVSGFDSDSFTVTSNGFVELKPQGNPYAASVLLTGGSDSGGQTTFTVDITSLFGAGALAKNCMAQVVTEAGRETVHPDVSGNGVGSMDFKFIPTVDDGVVNTSGYRVLITLT